MTAGKTATFQPQTQKTKMTENQLRGYLHAKKQHAKTRADRAIYAELIDDLRQFPDKLGEIDAVMQLIGA